MRGGQVAKEAWKVAPHVAPSWKLYMLMWHLLSS